MDTRCPTPLSPMAPPEAYSPPSAPAADAEGMHPLLRGLIEDHARFKTALDGFERAVVSIRAQGVTREANAALREFFTVFSEAIIPHASREEKVLFPVLARKLIASGERGAGDLTGVDMMEDDHLKSVQLTAVVFNFFALAAQLRDDVSRGLVLDAALEQSVQLIELLRLHIFREETVLFPLAQRLIAASEFDAMACGGGCCAPPEGQAPC